jgi:hypothetical protein
VARAGVDPLGNLKTVGQRPGAQRTEARVPVRPHRGWLADGIMRVDPKLDRPSVVSEGLRGPMGLRQIGVRPASAGITSQIVSIDCQT